MARGELIPNTFQHPNAYIDSLSYFLTPQEEKVLNKAIREILGWYNKIESRTARIALSVFVDGKFDDQGNRLCYGCGLGTSAVRKALDALDTFKILCKGDVTNDGQSFYLQDNVQLVDWNGLELRRAEWDKKNQERTQQAREAPKETGAAQGGIVTQEGGGVVPQQEGGIVGQQQRNPIETQKKLRQPTGEAAPFCLDGITVYPPTDIQTEYIDVMLFEYATEIQCPECRHKQSWPKTQKLRKRKEHLVCGGCHRFWRVTVSYDTAQADTYSVPLPKQEWTIALNFPVQNIGNRLRCDERDARLFMKNWQEKRQLVVDKLNWASTQSWLEHRRDVIVSRVNAAFESAMKGQMLAQSATQTQSNSTLDELRKAGYTEAQIEEMKTWSR